jgi:uncharacterized protein Yka (UPF0111/DUF47 family)
MESDDFWGRLFNKAKNIRLLPPRDTRFYNLFNELAETLVEASDELILLFGAPPEQRHEIERKIRACSIKMTRAVDSVEELLRTAQQPPFNRTEISELAVNMTKVMKYIKHAANRYVIYAFPTSDKEMRELAPVIKNACVEIANAIKGLHKDRKLESYCRAVEQFEKQADDIYHQGLARRFSEIRQDRIDTERMIEKLTKDSCAGCGFADLLKVEMSSLQYTRHVAVFFILREVYVELEKASDACTDVTSCLRRMVSENV